MSKTSSKRFAASLWTAANDWVFPLLILMCGAFFLFFSFQIERIGVETPGDPGPSFLPALLGGLLMTGGAILAGRQFVRRQLTPREEPPADSAVPSQERVMFGLVLGMLLYLPALSWLGFSVSTAIGGAVLLWALRTRVWVAVVYSIGLVVIVKLLFTKVFEVQLPEGLLTDWLTL